MSHPGSGQAFAKLEALGNDFVLLDCRERPSGLSAEQIRCLADRHTGIGFDQLLILSHAPDSDQDARVEIYNADGSSARQCGNGMRAIGLWLHRAMPERSQFSLATASGPISVRVASDGMITASMGQPDFAPSAVGLSPGMSMARLAESLPGLLALGTVSIGNPHLIVLLDQVATPALVQQWGDRLGLDPCWAAGINISFTCIVSSDRVSLRVHERGVGPTLACGSAACAAAAWLMQQSLIASPVQMEQPGGSLVIDWTGLGHPILMTGPARHVFDGILQ